MKKTLFIETDNKINEPWLKTLSFLFDKDYTTFDKMIINASTKGQEVLNAIVEADEIYVDSGLVYNPHGDGSILLNALMHKAVELGIEGKEVYFFRTLDQVNWFRLRKNLFDKTFKKNYLYVHGEKDNKYFWEQVDIDNLLKETQWMYQ